MRDPVERIVSHLRQVRHTKLFKDFFKGFPTQVSSTPSFTPAKLFALMKVLADNYYIRSLLGYDVFSLSVGRINETHLHRAKAKLEQFDVVLKTDDLTKP